MSEPGVILLVTWDGGGNVPPMLVASRLQSDLAVATADLLDALIARAAGRPDLGDRLARSALTAFIAVGAPCDASDALEVLGGCLLDLGNANDALRLLASASSTRTAHGWSVWSRAFRRSRRKTPRPPGGCSRNERPS